MSFTSCSDSAMLAGLNDSNIGILSKLAIKASRRGGEILMSHYGKIKNIENKGRIGDLVTSADLECEEEIVNYLRHQTPDINILAEESGLSGIQDGLCWCIDPLDGTTNFAHGYPFFATSIGLTWKDLPILGSICIPFINETYWSSPIEGAFCNQSAIQVSTSNLLIDSLLVTGFSYDRFNIIDNNYAEFCWLTNKTRGVRRGGAAAVDLAFVASGRLDGYWEKGLSKWDLAAGIALVQMAGGVISDYPDGNFDLSKGRVLATTPGIKEELMSELSKVIPLDARSYGSSAIDSIGS